MSEPTAAVAQPQVFGRLKAFELEEENTSTYLERMQLYFVANGARQTSVLLTVISPENYSVIKSLVALALLKDKSYTELYRRGVNNSFSAKTIVNHQEVSLLSAQSGSW